MPCLRAEVGTHPTLLEQSVTTVLELIRPYLENKPDNLISQEIYCRILMVLCLLFEAAGPVESCLHLPALFVFEKHMLPILPAILDSKLPPRVHASLLELKNLKQVGFVSTISIVVEVSFQKPYSEHHSSHRDQRGWQFSPTVMINQS